MSIYFKSKIIYPALLDGKATTLKELYLHEAINYTEVETQIPDILKTRVKTWDEDTVDGINKIKFNGIIFHPQQDEDAFYQVKVTMFFEKKAKYTYLVPAISYDEAGARVEDYLKGSLAVWEITNVDKSELLAFWHPKNELWQGDWHNRMERYYDEGKYEAGHNDVSQLDIDFEKKDDDESEEDREIKEGLKDALDYFGASEVTVTATNNGKTVKSVTLKSKDKKFNKGITFRKKNGDPVD